MKIAISGKGGSGKTTIAATLARLFAQRGTSVLAIDGDPNPNLGIALGIGGQGLDALQPLPRTIIEQRTDPEGNQQIALAEPMEAISSQYGVLAPDGVCLLQGGRVDHAGAG